MDTIYKYPVRWFSVLITLSLCFSVKAQTAPALSYFIKAAQTNSPLLNDYNNQVTSNKIDSLKLRATYGFIITGEATAGYSPNIKGWGTTMP